MCTKVKIEFLKEATGRLVEVIDRFGNNVTNKPFDDHIVLRNCILDLLKKIYANLNGFALLLDRFTSESNYLMKIPLSLCLRGALSDSLTAIYLYTFVSDEKSFENELTVMSIDYAKALKEMTTFRLKYHSDFSDLQFTTELEKWISDFKSKHPQFFNKSGEWQFISFTDIRKTSKFKPNGKTEKDKYEWIEKIYKDKKDKNHINLYYYYKHFSQYQHYNFSNRNIIEGSPKTDFIYFTCSIAAICNAFWVFASFFKQIDNDLKNDCEFINGKLMSSLELSKPYSS